VEGRAPAAQLVDDRLVGDAGELARPPGVEPRHGRVAAHAAGVGPLVPVEDPLVVLRRRERDRALPVAQREQRELLPVEELLEHDLGVAEAPLAEEHVERGARLPLVRGDDHALAGGQHVGLQDRRVGGTGEVSGRLLPVAQDEVRRGRHAAAFHQLLRVRLGALDARGRRGGAEGGDARRGQLVDEAGHERGLGTDDDEIDRALAGHADEVVCRQALDPVAGDAGVARRSEHLGLLGAPEQRADERVLAPSAADDQCALRHASCLTATR
jgi:hypothetical protein